MPHVEVVGKFGAYRAGDHTRIEDPELAAELEKNDVVHILDDEELAAYRAKRKLETDEQAGRGDRVWVTITGRIGAYRGSTTDDERPGDRVQMDLDDALELEELGVVTIEAELDPLIEVEWESEGAGMGTGTETMPQPKAVRLAKAGHVTIKNPDKLTVDITATSKSEPEVREGLDEEATIRRSRIEAMGWGELRSVAGDVRDELGHSTEESGQSRDDLEDYLVENYSVYESVRGGE